MENNKRTIIPISVSIIKTGTASKDGKSWKWTLSKVEAAVLPSQKQQTFSTFDDFSGRIDQQVEVEVEVKTNVKDGKTYTNYSIRLPKRNVWNELDKLTLRIEVLESKTTPPSPTIPGANDPSLGDENDTAVPEDAYNNEVLPF